MNARQGYKELLSKSIKKGGYVLIATFSADGPLKCSGLTVERYSVVTARHVIGQALPDLVLGCLSKALPGEILSESSGALWTISLTGNGKKTFSSLNVALGGMGARPNSDGLSTTAFPSGVGAVSVEIAEAAAPVIYHKKEFQPDSGGEVDFALLSDELKNQDEIIFDARERSINRVFT